MLPGCTGKEGKSCNDNSGVGWVKQNLTVHVHVLNLTSVYIEAKLGKEALFHSPQILS